VRTGLFSALAFAATAFAVPALAADLGAPPPMEPVAVPPVVESGWAVRVGAKAVVQPEWPGSKDYTVWPLPTLAVRDPGSPEVWGSPDDSFSIGLFGNEWIRVGIVGAFESGRDKSDDHKLKGLRPIDWAIEAGGFIEIWPVEWLRARAEVRHGFGIFQDNNGKGSDRDYGLVADLALDGVFKSAPWTFAVGPRASFASSDYMRTYFGITQREANRAPFFNRAYKPDGGLKSAGAAASISYDWDGGWRTTVFGGWNRLLDNAEKSPIVRKVGDKNQFFAGVGLSYEFNWTP
jgi:outer membrane scaffolding protein for murein synthesis (MipA/OmpV family)